MSVTAGQANGSEVIGAGTLKEQLARAERRNRLRAFLLVVPLLAFLTFAFFAPITFMLGRSFYDPLLPDNLPRTLEVLSGWERERDPLPPDEAYAALGEELVAARKARMLGRLATRLNYDIGGTRSLFTKTGRKLARMVKKGETPTDPAGWKQALLKIDRKWGKSEIWGAIVNDGHRYTLNFYLKALDFRRDWQGNIVREVANKRLYLLTGWDSVWVRTAWISLLVTVFCVLLGYPVSYLLANLPLRISNLLMILVLLPFWTSLLVRTTAWIVVLQTQGVLNDLMLFLGILDERIQLIFNRFGVVVAMTHILLPFMILPIYSVMKNISPSYVRAARSLGATPFTAFWKVYFPQSVPGIGAGALLVFILALGYYITPALVGGPRDQLMSYFVALHTTKTLNWGLASALGSLLLAAVTAVYVLYDRLVGIDNMKLG